jgi:hypothetical protein
MKLTTLVFRTHAEREYEIELECDVTFDPGYPAPFAQDHDDPRFSDPGDPGSLEVQKATVLSSDPSGWLKDGEALPGELTEQEIEKLRKLAEDQLSEELEGRDDDV